MTKYRFNYLRNEYETIAAERAALVFRGTHEVEVWRDGEEIGSLNIDIYSDVSYSDFDDKALSALGEFANANHRKSEGSDNYEIVAEGLDNLTVSYEDAISSAEHMAQVWAVEWVERGDKIYVGGELYARRID